MEYLIVLIVTFSSFAGGGIGSTTNKNHSTYTIPGFTSIKSYEVAKAAEVKRLSKVTNPYKWQISAECVKYKK